MERLACILPKSKLPIDPQESSLQLHSRCMPHMTNGMELMGLYAAMILPVRRQQILQ